MRSRSDLAVAVRRLSGRRRRVIAISSVAHLVRRDLESALPERGHAGRVDREVVTAHGERRKGIVALRVGRRRELRARLGVRGRHHRVGSRAACRIRDRAADPSSLIGHLHLHLTGRGGCLRQGPSGPRQAEDERDRPSGQRHGPTIERGATRRHLGLPLLGRMDLAYQMLMRTTVYRETDREVNQRGESDASEEFLNFRPLFGAWNQGQ